MAEAVPFGIVTTMLTKLGSSAFRELSLVYGVENDMRKLENTMSTVKAALLDADQRQENSHLVRDWIKKLNYVVYDADDVLDAFSTKGLQRKLSSTDGRVLDTQVCEFFSSSNSLAFRYKMGQKIKHVRQRLDEIATDMRNLNFMPERVIVGARVNYEGRETHSFVLVSEVFGRDKEKEEIIQLLMCSGNQKENVSVIPIVGMGGLGKTTLAQLIYSDERVVKYFELRIWVCVSEDFETKSLVRKILKSITNNVVAKDLDLEQLQSQLRQNLDGKRYLLMLDDVWNETSEKWAGVRNLLMGGAKGSIIVVTTRSRIVASVMGVEHPYVLEGLSKEESWSLFEKVAFGGHEKVNTKLMVIGKDIVMRCKRVPLAIRSLASVLQSKTEESDWRRIQNSDIWHGDDILPILKLSYDHLPSYLKQCFAYCAIFPKDHEIEKELLIQLWMAQGYVQSPDTSQHLEEIGNNYFRDLLSRSFFQEARVDDDNNEVLISYKMHDLIHDLAMRVAGFDCRIVERDANNISERIRHVLISRDGTKVPAQLMKAKGLRTLLGSDSLHICKVLSKFRCLRVLDVSNCEVKKVPKSIGKLQYLRYLDLSGNDFTSLPDSIKNLINLQTLELSYCQQLEKLPKGITKLINLRNLMMDECDELNHMPSGMGKLKSLQRLNKFVVGGNNNKSVRLSELNGLNELRGDIWIEGLENVRDAESESKKANLKAKQYLDSLTLEWGGEDSSKFDDAEILLEGLQPHSELKELIIYGYSGQMLPSWMMVGNMVNSLPNIVSITLAGCDRCRQLPPFDQLPFLKVLDLSSMLTVEYQQLIDDNNFNLASSSSLLFFPSLEELCIEDLPNLKGWCSSREGASELLLWSEQQQQQQQQRPSFPRLTTLKIANCPKLTSMPMIPHVEKLYLRQVCEKLLRQVLTTTEGSASSSSSSSSSIPSYVNYPLSKLRSLRIQEINGLESLPEEVLRSLEHLEIYFCPKLTSMPIHLSHLEKLVVDSVPEKLVRQLLLTSAATTTAITASSSSSHPLSKLKHLRISNIDELESLPVAVFRNLASLGHLEIHRCPRLSCFAVSDKKEKEEEEEEEEEGFRAFTSLHSLSIGWCDSLTSLSGLTQHLTALQTLTIRFCQNFDLSDDHWQGLRSLRELVIGEIPKLASLPVGLQQVTTLQLLNIQDCPGLIALPDWLSNLTSLQRLDIHNCPLLSERCQKETGEDWSKISHIPQIVTSHCHWESSRDTRTESSLLCSTNCTFSGDTIIALPLLLGVANRPKPIYPPKSAHT